MGPCCKATLASCASGRFDIDDEEEGTRARGPGVDAVNSTSYIGVQLRPSRGPEKGKREGEGEEMEMEMAKIKGTLVRLLRPREGGHSVIIRGCWADKDSVLV